MVEVDYERYGDLDISGVYIDGEENARLGEENSRRAEKMKGKKRKKGKRK